VTRARNGTSRSRDRDGQVERLFALPSPDRRVTLDVIVSPAGTVYVSGDVCQLPSVQSKHALKML
jgi:hypothetical protein